MIRAIRGAIQISDDRPALIHEAARKLILTMLEWNEVGPDDLISILFTMTPDLNSAFPAAAARAAGLENVPMMCATEIAVPDSMPRVIRVMTHVETARPRAEIRHPYLGGAARLRPDLAMLGERR